MFDSHVSTLLDVAASLVNTLTSGTRRGRPYTAPRDTELPAAVCSALPAGSATPDGLGMEQATHLTHTARRLRAVFDAVDADLLDAAAREINGLLATSGARPQLDHVPGEPWQLHFHGAEDSVAVGWSAGCATALALAVGSDVAGRLGVCTADRCDRVYVDSSRNAARQFCSTACQNRMKAAAFRARKRSADGAM